MDYSDALDLIKEGAVVTRKRYQKEFCFKLVRGFADLNRVIDYGIDEEIPIELFNDLGNLPHETARQRSYYPYIACLFPEGIEYKGWLLNDVDLLSEDWIEIDEGTLFEWGHEKHLQ